MPDLTAHIKKLPLSINTMLMLILGVVAFSLYANTLSNGYVLDDRSVIAENKIVTKGVSAIPEIFHTPYLRGYIATPNDLYRPMSLAMFAIEYQLSGGSPIVGHTVNVLLFAGCVVLLFLFLDALFDKKKTTLAFITSLLFALHPIHTEVVANIKSRDELLCFFFAFLSLNVFIKYSRGGKMFHLALGSLFCFLSLLSRETGVTMLLLVPLLFFGYSNDNKKRSASVTLATILPVAVFLFIRFSVLIAYHANQTFLFTIDNNALAAAPSLAIRVSSAFFILGKYLRLLVIPYPLICDYSYNSVPVVSLSNPGAFTSLVFYLFLGAVGIYRLMTARKDIIALSILFFLITLSLFSNLFFLVGATMAERFLFFPSVGFCLLLAYGILRVAETNAHRKYFTAGMVALVSLFYIPTTLARNKDWKDALTLYKNDARHQPDSYRISYYLGTTLINNANELTDTAEKNKTITDGIGYLKRSLAIHPGFSVLYAEIGNSYLKRNDYDSAERYLQDAIAVNAKDTFSMTGLAALYFKTGRYRQSLSLCKSILLLDSGYSRGYRNMGSCYLKLGIYDSAVVVLKKALVLEPVKSAYGYLSLAYKLSGMPDSAQKYEVLASQFPQ